eukprot:GHVL01041651.1.p1 GENE.GHVL01041651.1~~GHVL01041651.1.p1  ORF type:complete len:164 (-),score=29.34 GHVL01041651.1:110-601(-)
MEGIVKLKSKDNDIIEALVRNVSRSTLISNIIEDAGIEEEIPLIQVSTETLKKVLLYCNHWVSNEPPEIAKPLVDSTPLKNQIDDWDHDFVAELSKQQLLDLILAANFLNIPTLLDLLCAKLADQIRGKSPEEIRTFLGITNDYTPDEEQQMLDKYKWIDQSY